MSRPTALLGRAWKSPALRATVGLGFGGVGFALGNLLMARALPEETYGRIALVIALIQLGTQLGPAGVTGIINRELLDTGPGILLRCGITASLAGLVFVAIGRLLYGVTVGSLLLLALSVVGGSLAMLASAHYQSRQRFGYSLVLYQGSNVALLIAGALAILMAGVGQDLVLAIFSMGYVVAALIGWSTILGSREALGEAGTESFHWAEALSYLGVQMVGATLVQAERLALPKVLSYEALATFGVLTATAGAPFRMLQSGVGYTTIPRLSSTSSLAERRRILFAEGLLVCSLAGVLALVLVPVTPPIVRLLMAGKYRLTTSLVLAVVVAGLIKVLSSFVLSAAAALTDARELAVLNWLGWLGVGVSIGGAVVGSRWGLQGVIYGVSGGWVLRALVAAHLSAPHLGIRLPWRESPRHPSSDPGA